RVVVRRATEFALLRSRRIAERHTKAASDAEIRPDCAHHPTVAIGLLNDTTGHRAGCLTNRTSKRTKTPIGIDHCNRLEGLRAKVGHYLRRQGGLIIYRRAGVTTGACPGPPQRYWSG